MNILHVCQLVSCLDLRFGVGEHARSEHLACQRGRDRPNEDPKANFEHLQSDEGRRHVSQSSHHRRRHI